MQGLEWRHVLLVKEKKRGAYFQDVMVRAGCTKESRLMIQERSSKQKVHHDKDRCKKSGNEFSEDLGRI